MGVQTETAVRHRGPGAQMVPPVSRRGFFMTTSAAAAAGYTLLAGPVRADAIKTDTNGLTVGDAKVKVAGGDMPVYFARPANVANPPVILVAMEIFGVHEYIQRRHPPAGAAGRTRDRARLLFPRRRRSHQDRATCRSCSRSSTPSPTRSCSPISTPRWPGRSSRAATPTGSASWASAAADARCGTTRPTTPISRPASPSTAPWATRERTSGRRTRSSLAAEVKEPVLGLYGADEPASRSSRSRRWRRAQGRRQDRRIPYLPGRAARLPRRLSRKLPQGSGQAGLGRDGEVVQEVQSAVLILGRPRGRRARRPRRRAFS